MTHADASLWQLFKAIPRAIASLIVGVGNFLSTQWRQYNQMGQFLWLLALFAMAIDAGISYEFGSTLSLLHAGGFALVALAFCILPDVASLEWRKGNRTAAGWFAVACVPLGFVAFMTHVGYSASIRVGDMQQTDVQNAAWKTRQDAVAEEKSNLEMWRKQLADLKDQNAWTATVTAEGLRAQLATADKKVELEGKRGGCKSKCLKLMEEKAALEDKIATAEKVDDLSKRIEATQRIIDGKRTAAVSTEFKSSAAANHNDTLFKAASLAFSGDFREVVSMTEREATNTGVMGLSSIAFLLLAPLFYLAAGLNRRAGIVDAWAGHGEEPMGIWERQAERNAATAMGAPNIYINGDPADDVRQKVGSIEQWAARALMQKVA
jgi:hypothetical protein